MSSENLKKGQFKLPVNLMVQNLLLTSLGMCKFAMLHEKHPMSQAIRQFKLFDPAHLDRFIEMIKNARTGQTLVLTLADEILIYTAMDITCKAYLTDLGDEMEQMNAEALNGAKSSFAEIRSTVLKGCQFVMEGMRDTLKDYPEFEDRTDILENYILV